MKRDWTKFYRELGKVLRKEFKWDKKCYLGAGDSYEKCEDCQDYCIRLGIGQPCIDAGG